MIDIELAVALFLAAFVCEFIDSSMGMLYGTILSPVLIIMGFSPLLVVPSILLSQSIGGLTASVFHHKFKNVEFKLLSKDSITVYMITAGGILMTILAVAIAIQVPKAVINTYIGLLVLVMGAIILSQVSFYFSWKKIGVVGMISSFNKGLTGGGFGPVVTGGQVVVGRGPKQAIGATTLAEAPICITGFLTYALASRISDWSLPFVLCAGAALSAPLGAYATYKFPHKKMKSALGILIVVLGVWTLLKVGCKT